MRRNDVELDLAAFGTPNTSHDQPRSIQDGDTRAHETTTHRKSRIALACTRCKRRKQRCDGSRPSCQACTRSKQACVYERIARPQYPGGKALYISTLEERIAFLEARLPDHAEDHLSNVPEKNQQTSPALVDVPHASPRARRESCRESYCGSNSDDLDFDDGTSLVDGVAYLSLCASGTANTSDGQFYVGSSSGATIARMIQSSIYHRSDVRSADCDTTSRAHKAASSMDIATQPATCDLSVPSAALPSYSDARMLFDFFFERIHPRWPLLDRTLYEDIFDDQYLPGTLSIAQRSILHLIYAITARFLAVTRKPCGIDDEAQLSAATRPMEKILNQHDLETVQFLVLLGVHGQRSPYGAGAWSQIRFATSVCIEMGLHRKRAPSSSEALRKDAEIRRRVFWSCYCLDRVTSIVLGRAFAIADRDINVELPGTHPDLWSLTHKENYDPNKGQWSNVQPFIHIIKLDRIQSRIHKTIFRVDRDFKNCPPEERVKLNNKMSIIRSDLDEWVDNYPQTPKTDNKSTWMYDPENACLDARDFYCVQYHKAVLYLFTIFLPILETTDERFVTCACSAASVCNAYKRLSQNKTLTYTMISLHSCFVAGLTLVYCIWRDKNLFSYDVIEATQSCSQILTIFGEKWPGAVKYRDIFDALSQSLFKLAMRPRSATTRLTEPQPLQLNVETQSLPSKQTTNKSDRYDGSDSLAQRRGSKSTMSQLVTEAVKDAFMEVDEEAPGGWQGWRMWNEMVKSDEASTIRSSEFDMLGNGSFETNWLAGQGSAGYAIDPFQEAVMQPSDSAMLNQNQWNLSGYR